MEAAYEKIIEIIKSNQSFLICSHAHPDGDGIGSTLAMGLALESVGKKAVMYNQDGVPKSLDFLPGSDRLVTHIDKDAAFDVSIMVDCGQPERIGENFPSGSRRGKLVCIDHHVTGGEKADVSCLDEKASSTGEVVYKVLNKMGISISADLATLILTTIIVDTGFFRYSNATSRALSLASHLVDRGATTWLISKNMEERNPPQQLDLLASAIRTIEYLLNGRLAIMVLTQQMLAWADAGVEMAEEFINFPRSVNGVEVAALIREKCCNEYKVSFRSKDSLDVAALALKFGGGGHKHAAGCTINGRLGTVKQIVIRAVEEALNY